MVLSCWLPRLLQLQARWPAGGRGAAAALTGPVPHAPAACPMPLRRAPPAPASRPLPRQVEESVAASGGAGLSVDRLLDIIRQHSRGWRRDRLKPFPELRFTYEEGSARGAGGGCGGGGWGAASRRWAGGPACTLTIVRAHATHPTLHPPPTQRRAPRSFLAPLRLVPGGGAGRHPFSLPAIVLFTPHRCVPGLAAGLTLRYAGLLWRAAAPPPRLMAVRRAPLPQWCQTWRARMRRRSPARW